MGKHHHQYVIAAVVNIAAMAAGMTLGFSAVALPPMQVEDHIPRISLQQASWIASMASVAFPVGCLAIGALLNGLGRKKALMVINLPAVLGWLLLATTSQHHQWFFYQVYAGRFLTGIATGMASTPATVYLSEVADKQLRGVLVTWTSIGMSLGILLVYILGLILQENWRTVAWISACFPILSAICVWILVPESPVWLASRGHIKEAEMVMRRVRGVMPEKSLPDDLQEELDSMVQSSRNKESPSWRDMLKIIKRPEAYKPLLIMNAFFFFQQFSGGFVVIFYAVSIVKETGVDFDGYVASVLIGITRLLGTIGISYGSRRYGRRVFCNISGVGMSISMIVLAAFLALMNDGTLSKETVATYSWVPIFALVMMILTSSIGFLTLPWAMLGEVFPYEIRGPACGFTSCMAYVFCFFMIKLFPDLRLAWGSHGIFAFYGLVGAVGTVAMYKFLPETQGRTLEQVQQNFRKKRTPEKEKLPEDILLQEKT